MATIDGTLNGIVAISVGTDAAWAATTQPLQNGVLAFESNTKKMKVGDGTSLYSALPYTVDEVFTTAFRTLLQNAGSANGVAVLDANGLIPVNKIPAQFQNRIVFVADITARDAIPTAERVAVVYVVDANADVTVTAGSAYYGWDETGAAWIKLGEQESMDVDVSSFLVLTGFYLLQSAGPDQWA